MSVLGPPAAGDVRARVLSGVAWKAISQSTLQVTRLAVSIVLARLLTPHDWGLAAMVVLFSGIVVLFGDSALGTALVQRRTLTERDRSTVFWTSLGIGAVLTAAGVLCAGPIASFYGEPSVRPLFVVASAGFAVSCLGTAQTSLLVRDMRFRALELRQIAATLIGAAVGVSVALAGYGAWAIVLQQLASALTATVLVWVACPWRPSFSFSAASLRSLSGFTGSVFAQNLLFLAGRSGDKLLVGRFLGASPLGAYALATNVVLAPFNQVAAPLQQVMFPAMAQMQDDPRRLAAVWIRTTRLVGAFSVPALVGLIVVAPDLITVVFGERWHDAAPVVQALAAVGIMQSLQTLNGEVLLALGRAGTLLWFTAVWLAGLLGSVALGIQWGLIGVALCYAAAGVVVEPLNAYLTARALGIPVWHAVRPLVPVVLATAPMAAATLVVRLALEGWGVSAPLRLGLVVALGIGVYLPCLVRFAPEVVAEVGSLRRPRALAPSGAVPAAS